MSSQPLAVTPPSSPAGLLAAINKASSLQLRSNTLRNSASLILTSEVKAAGSPLLLRDKALVTTSLLASPASSQGEFEMKQSVQSAGSGSFENHELSSIAEEISLGHLELDRSSNTIRSTSSSATSAPALSNNGTSARRMKSVRIMDVHPKERYSTHSNAERSNYKPAEEGCSSSPVLSPTSILAKHTKISSVEGADESRERRRHSEA